MERECAPPPGLPANFYDTEWLSDLEERDLEAYELLDVQAPVDLTLPGDVVTLYKRFRHCRTRDDRPLSAEQFAPIIIE
ncbi:uncharacterized protein B0H18DRAFT_1015998 [Fomitopsis serialis]|uniref:uncharacterized protein n=1 Tax=Fomitopsis serialis TaxID=139415 RepID=UPI002007AA6F|nr:uncharacterized protein B0H18DRAFT_1015998 [Neoantrodia serialis]KAH9923071.1 hypothetical protein B0H18DRAFT_1015998 [Neoantrodia serialis]